MQHFECELTDGLTVSNSMAGVPKIKNAEESAFYHHSAWRKSNGEPKNQREPILKWMDL
jgi:hypothetical protein